MATRIYIWVLDIWKLLLDVWIWIRLWFAFSSPLIDLFTKVLHCDTICETPTVLSILYSLNKTSFNPLINNLFTVWSYAMSSDMFTNCFSNYRGLTDIRCIVFVERVITAVVLKDLLNALLPKYSSWKTRYIAGNHFGLQNQTRKRQNEIVEEFRAGLVCCFDHPLYCYKQSTVFD